MIFTTIIQAIDKDGQLRTFVGPNVPGESYEDAQYHCDNNGLGYCRVDGILVEEIPYKPDFNPN